MMLSSPGLFLHRALQPDCGELISRACRSSQLQPQAGAVGGASGYHMSETDLRGASLQVELENPLFSTEQLGQSRGESVETARRGTRNKAITLLPSATAARLLVLAHLRAAVAHVLRLVAGTRFCAPSRPPKISSPPDGDLQNQHRVVVAAAS